MELKVGTFVVINDITSIESHRGKVACIIEVNNNRVHNYLVEFRSYVGRYPQQWYDTRHFKAYGNPETLRILFGDENG